MIALRILYYGWVLLAVAILLNACATQLSIHTWYSWLQLIQQRGLGDAWSSLRAQDLAFLFLLYPAALGLLVHWLSGSATVR